MLLVNLLLFIIVTKTTVVLLVIKSKKYLLSKFENFYNLAVLINIQNIFKSYI